MKKIAALVSFCLLLSTGCYQKQTVDDVVMKMNEAAGGADKLAAITDRVETWDFTMMQPPPGDNGEGEMPPDYEGGPMTMPMTITAKKPNKLRFDLQGPDGSIQMSSCYDGEKGWKMEMGEHKEMTGAELQETQTMAATWIDGFTNYKDKGLTLALLPNETLDAKEYLILQSTDAYGNVQKYYIDPATHYIMRQAGEMVNMMGEKEMMHMTFSDYKMFDDVAIPNIVAQHGANGEKMWEATFKEAKHNTGVEDDAFMATAMSMK